MLSRVIHGTRISLYVAVTSIAVAMALGGALGLAAGYLGDWASPGFAGNHHSF